MAKNTNLWIGIVLVVLAVLIFSGKIKIPGFQAVITPPSQMTLEEKDGRTVWVATIEGIENSEKFFFYGAEAPTSKEDEKPTADFWIDFRKQEDACTYGIEKVKSTSCMVGFGLPSEYYILSNPQRSSIIRVDSDKSADTPEIDAAVIGSRVILDDIDNIGTVEIEALGFLSGVRGCPEYSNVIYAPGYYICSGWFCSTKTPMEFISKSSLDAECAKSVWMQSSSNLKSDIFASSFINTKPDIMGGSFKGIMPLNTFGGILTLRADAGMVEAITYKPSPVAQPMVTNVDIAEKLASDSEGTLMVTIDNKADVTGNVLIEITSPSLTVIDSPKTITLEKEAKVPFAFITGKVVESDQQIPLIVKACSIGGILEQYCDDFTKYTLLLKVGSGVKPLTGCGNGICEPYLGETYLNCAKDGCTKIENCDAIPYSHLQEGICVCDEGYKMELYTSGIEHKTRCVKPTNWMVIGVIAGLAIAVLLLIWPKKKRTTRFGRR